MRWALDAVGNVIHRDDIIAKETGAEASKIKSRERWQLIHPDDVESSERQYQKALRDHAPFIATFRMKLANGGFERVLSGGIPSFDPLDNNFLGYFGSMKPLKNRSDILSLTIFLQESSLSNANSHKIIILDTITDNIISSRALAEKTHEHVLIRALDFVLLELGHLFQKSTNLKQ